MCESRCGVIGASALPVPHANLIMPCGRWLFDHGVALALRLRVLTKQRSGIDVTAAEKQPIAARKRLAHALIEPWLKERASAPRRRVSGDAPGAGATDSELEARLAKLPATRLSGCVMHATFKGRRRFRCKMCATRDPKSNYKSAW